MAIPIPSHAPFKTYEPRHEKTNALHNYAKTDAGDTAKLRAPFVFAT